MGRYRDTLLKVELEGIVNLLKILTRRLSPEEM